MVKLSEEKEVELLLKSIEEESKHARNVLLASLVASIYILLSAFSGHTEPNVTLPIINVTVKSAEFFAYSPIILLCLYLYLHIYVADLRTRLAVFEKADLAFQHIPARNMLLFPWIVNLAFSSSSSDQATIIDFGARETYVRFVAVFLVWVLGPLILFALWMLYVGQERAISLIPCSAFVIAMYGRSNIWRIRRSARYGTLAISIPLIAITFASVPVLRAWLPLEAVWNIAKSLPGLVMTVRGMMTLITLLLDGGMVALIRLLISKVGLKALKRYRFLRIEFPILVILNVSVILIWVWT